jgi:hypothetical protein
LTLVQSSFTGGVVDGDESRRERSTMGADV